VKGIITHSAALQRTGPNARRIALLPRQGDGFTDFGGGWGEINPEFGSDVCKTHKSDESENREDKQKLEEFA
tara:strand:- start:1268 stop:1483 length:216 start_codon:yes stop_codon:yes gene_type:complete